MEKWARSLYLPNLPLKDRSYVTASPEHIALSRAAAAEGMVLLKNSTSLLPLTCGTPLALFGKATFDYVKGGGGSGDVHCPYIHNLYDALQLTGYASAYEPLAEYYRDQVQEQYSAGRLPGMTIEPELPEALLMGAREFSDTAIISISRFSGEGWDRSDADYEEPFSPYPAPDKTMPQTAAEIFPEGDFYLTKEERSMVGKVCAAFPNVIVLLNIGGVMDTRWIRDDDRIQSALLVWQGGMEGGLAAADLLFGKETPCGKLPDTFAGRLSDYPSSAGFHESPHYVEYIEDIYVGYRYFKTIPGAENAVCYPFGYGLSYTGFDISEVGFAVDADQIRADFQVTNTGAYSGKEVVQLYCAAPQGKLGKPRYILCGFCKTGSLNPGEAETVTITVPLSALASFDDTGEVCPNAFVLEQGSYEFFFGSGLHDLKKARFVYSLAEDLVLEQLAPKLCPTSLPRRLRADGTYQELTLLPEHGENNSVIPRMPGASAEGLNPAQRPYPRRLRRYPFDPGVHPLSDVAAGECSLDAFLDQLSDEDLIHLLGGQPNTGVANTFGLGNLPEYGIPNIMTADGPAGVRIEPNTGVRTTAFPCGTLLAATWNPELVAQVGAAGGAELKENNLCVWLTPAVNIHRNPYCGRNFEYYSEDPLLAGLIGAAMVRGIQSNQVSACVKHFACNNKEVNRKNSDSRLSQRALREIYLKVFEIVVKTADPWAIMTSYNVINGQRASESRELLEDILRDEWSFRGVVVTDWWNRGEQYLEILAGNDVKMGTGFPERVKEALDLGAITRGDLIRSARRVLQLILKMD